MEDAFSWLRRRGAKQAPWVVFGKGPSFAKRATYDCSAYLALGLNHVCREQPVTLAHVIDLDVIDACGDALLSSTEAVVMPWWPHTKNRSLLAGILQAPTRLSDRNLEQLSHEHEVLGRLRAQGRLLWYNLSTGPRHDDSPVVQVRFFSSEAALNLLALAGVRVVRSLGIDGGASYSGEFADLRDKTLLANGRSSFDVQFGQIAKTIMTTGIDYAPLDVESPLRVYVATTEAQMLSVRVLEYSIRKHTSLTVEVVPMHLSGRQIPMPKDPKNQPRTPFSFQRFLIPELAGYQGRAVYLDSDMQVFRDMRELWTLPFEGASLLAAREAGESGRRPQFSVMLLDCSRLRWNIDEIVAALDRGELTYESLMYQMSIAPEYVAGIDAHWNSLERYDADTRLVHYTDMDTQPWVSAANPIGHLWMRDLFEAIDRGFISRDFVAAHVEQGWVRPSLLHQIDLRQETPKALPREVAAADEAFQAPFREIGRRRGARSRQPAKAIKRLYSSVRRRLWS